MPDTNRRRNPPVLDGFQRAFSGGVLIIWGALHTLEPFVQFIDHGWRVPLAVDAAFLVTAAGVHPGIRAAVLALFARQRRNRDPPE